MTTWLARINTINCLPLEIAEPMGSRIRGNRRTSAEVAHEESHLSEGEVGEAEGKEREQRGSKNNAAIQVDSLAGRKIKSRRSQEYLGTLMSHAIAAVLASCFASSNLASASSCRSL